MSNNIVWDNNQFVRELPPTESNNILSQQCAISEGENVPAIKSIREVYLGGKVSIFTYTYHRKNGPVPITGIISETRIIHKFDGGKIINATASPAVVNSDGKWTFYKSLDPITPNGLIEMLQQLMHGNYEHIDNIIEEQFVSMIEDFKSELAKTGVCSESTIVSDHT